MSSSRPLPSGTVTLLLADQQGSSREWQRDPTAMAAVVPRLQQLVSDEIERHDGARPLEQGEGDSFAAAFAHAADGAACALAIQRATQTADWPGGIQPSFRMALHTGDVEFRDPNNYMGSTINRCGRLRSLAAGGQILVSRTTTDLLYDSMPAGAKVLDLGPHLLKGFDRPEVIFQLCHPDLPSDFPVLELDEAAPPVPHPGTAPIPLTPTIGRDRDIRNVVTLLREGKRLVTLTGTGGVGKTRLALEIARELRDDFGHGVHFLPLASIEDHALVIPTFAQRYSIPLEGQQDALDAVLMHLRMRHLLLIIDNFEHVTGAAPAIAAILESCSRVQILVTSRQLLHLAMEYAYDVEPLPTPPPSGSTAAAVRRAAAVQLFLERTRQTGGALTLTDDNAAAIAELCRRLDGLPLAIELAAARTRLLPPAALLDRLEQRLDVLTAGSADAADRHRTLRATIDWSHDLLAEPERAMLARLSVFSGGCTLAAADAVCRLGDDEPEVVETVSALLEQSLLVVMPEGAAGDPRLSMLQTVRTYAWERLAERGEMADVQRRHLYWARDLMEDALPHLSGADQRERTRRLDQDRDNVRAAVRHAIDIGDADAVARIAFASYIYQSIRDSLTELRDWIDRSAPLMGTADPMVRARHQLTGALCAISQGDLERAQAFLGPALAAFEGQGGFEEGIARLGEGIVADVRGDRELADRCLHDASDIFEGIGNDWGRGYAESTLGDRALRDSDVAHAVSHHECALALARGMENAPLAGRSLTRLALTACIEGDLAATTRHLEEAAVIYHTAGYRSGLVFCLDAGVIAAVTVGQPRAALLAAGAAETARQATGSAVWPTMQALLDDALGRAIDELGEEPSTEAIEAGRAVELDEAVAAVIAALGGFRSRAVPE